MFLTFLLMRVIPTVIRVLSKTNPENVGTNKTISQQISKTNSPIHRRGKHGFGSCAKFQRNWIRLSDVNLFRIRMDMAAVDMPN